MSSRTQARARLLEFVGVRALDASPGLGDREAASAQAARFAPPSRSYAALHAASLRAAGAQPMEGRTRELVER